MTEPHTFQPGDTTYDLEEDVERGFALLGVHCSCLGCTYVDYDRCPCTERRCAICKCCERHCGSPEKLVGIINALYEGDGEKPSRTSEVTVALLHESLLDKA